MEVLCACDQRFLPHTATMLCSLLEHNSVSRIHLFYSSVSEHELAKLEALVARYASKISFYEIVLADLQDLRVDKWASVAVYYRLLAPRLLPADLDKVLYLDFDIIVRQSLKDLWNIDLTGHALGAVPNFEDDARKALGLPEGTKYFNSGVLLINLWFWRQSNVAERAISFIRNNPTKVQYWDQDALNATLVRSWIELQPPGTGNFVDATLDRETNCSQLLRILLPMTSLGTGQTRILSSRNITNIASKRLGHCTNRRVVPAAAETSSIFTKRCPRRAAKWPATLAAVATFRFASRMRPSWFAEI